VTEGGRDHSSHRLVRYGLSEKHAVLLLGLLAAALGAASLGYNVLGDQWITLPALLLTFLLLVQFASFLADLEQRPTAGEGLLRAFDVHWRRLVEVAVDFALVGGAFLTAYFLQFGGQGTNYQRFLFLQTLPVLIAARYVAFILFGLYRSVWRFAVARDLAAIVVAVAVSELAAALVLHWTQVVPPGDFAQTVFVIDALLCIALVAASRFGERAALQALRRRRREGLRRTLIVGAGRSGRSLHRELRETDGERVVGFVDDNPRLRRRRVHGVPVLGATREIERLLERTNPDIVLITIPDASRETLDAVVDACVDAGVTCRFVRREIDLDPHVVLGSAAE